MGADLRQWKMWGIIPWVQICAGGRSKFKLENNSSSICKPCQNKSHDNLDNVWVEFPFDDDFFGDKEIASFDEKINNDAYKTDPVADWKAFNN